MAISSRLVGLDGTELLRFGPFDPYWLITFELGYPDVREVSQPVPGRDGENDITAHFGAAAHTMTLRIRDDQPTSRDALLDQLRGYCSPKLRAYLHLTKDGWPDERRTLVRGVQAPATFDRPGPLPISVGWKAPRGVWESTVQQSQVLFPSSGSAGGAPVPWIFPLQFAAGNVPGAASLSNGGTVDALPFIDIYGFCTNPVIKNLTTGEQLAFTGLTVQAGDFIRVDMARQVALLSNDAGQSRYGFLDFTSLTWWGLPPGSSQIAFLPGNPGSTCQAVIYFRDSFI